MIHFQCDYAEGAHPKIMERLVETNSEQTLGYGEDPYCAQAADKIRKACGDESLEVHFLVGGTQTNLTVIDAALRAHQAVISADTGHINVHETGAVEACGHKVLALASEDGKLTPEQIEKSYLEHLNLGGCHMVQPKMVYISSPTELGTIYYKKELQAISEICEKYGLYLFLDGARLGYGLSAPDNDLDLQTIASLCDVFYIGGTKVGALFGEAVVIRKEALKEDFRYFMKQKGGMLAKGRLLGIQFDTLFTDDLYVQIARNAVSLAERLRKTLQEKGYALVPGNTNQIFVTMPDEHLEILAKRFVYSYDHKVNETQSMVRFCTSWATTEENVEQLIAVVQEL